MADDQPSLHIDTDWKKQAQEEKRRLAEQQEKLKAEQSKPASSPFAGAASPAAAISAPSSPSKPAGRGQPGAKELPPASFAALVQSTMTQIFYYLGDLSPRGTEPAINLDMAKHQIDILGVLEEKTKGNLTEDEQRLLDAALYETRMRYVNVAAQYIT